MKEIVVSTITPILDSVGYRDIIMLLIRKFSLILKLYLRSEVSMRRRKIQQCSFEALR